jgi:phosphoribosylformylglycinamidine synthase subunit PurS
MKAHVEIQLKAGVLDPQGKAVEQSLHGLGFAGVRDVRMGKVITLEVAAGSATEAEAQVKAMCDQLLANPVIESYTIELR